MCQILSDVKAQADLFDESTVEAWCEEMHREPVFS